MALPWGLLAFVFVIIVPGTDDLGEQRVVLIQSFRGGESTVNHSIHMTTGWEASAFF